MPLNLQDLTRVTQKLEAFDMDESLKQGVRDYLKGFAERYKHITRLDFTSYNAEESYQDHVLADSPCRLYVWYARKRGNPTGSVKLYDDRTNANTATDLRDIFTANASNQEFLTMIPLAGKQFGVGVVIASHTSSGGTTDTSLANAFSGFAIVGEVG